MATPLTPDQWLTILRAEGVHVVEYPGWRTRERDDETGKPFGAVHMFLNHHTAGYNSRDVVARDGVPGLPAPLAHVYLAKDGTATMCSAGRANHAGLMAANAFASFRDEQSTHPAPSKASGTVDGNDVAYGIETENRGDGKDVYPRAQYDAWVRINAAVCRFHGWGAESVGCHKETSIEGKPDPLGPVEGYGSRGRFDFTPAQFRRDVDERLKHPASWSPGEATKPSTTEPEEDEMPTAREIAAAVMEYQIDDPRTEGTKYVPAKSVLWWAGADAAQANAAVKDVAKRVQALEQRALSEDDVQRIAAAVAALIKEDTHV